MASRSGSAVGRRGDGGTRGGAVVGAATESVADKVENDMALMVSGDVDDSDKGRTYGRLCRRVVAVLSSFAVTHGSERGKGNHDAERRPSVGGAKEGKKEKEKRRRCGCRGTRAPGEARARKGGHRDTRPPRTRAPRQRKEGTISPGHSGKRETAVAGAPRGGGGGNQRGERIPLRGRATVRWRRRLETPSSQSPTGARNARTNGTSS